MVVGPPEKNPRKYMICIACVSVDRAVCAAGVVVGAAAMAAEFSSDVSQSLA